MESWFPGGTALNWADYLVVAGSFAVLVVIGLWAGPRENTTSDFFLGGRRMPVWAVVLSFVATEISAMTIIGVPAIGYRENWQYVQFFFGSAAARLAVAFLFIPAFYELNCVTIYEYLRHRFGPATQYAGTAFFFVTRLLASGVRLMAACVAVSVLMGWHIIPTILLFTVVSGAYITYGGVRAVIWTNVMQALTFLSAGLATLAYLAANIDGGVLGAAGAAAAAGKLNVFNWGPGPGEADWLRKFFSDPNILWIAVLNGFFGSMAAFGTDHEMVQRLLTVETRRESQRTMVWTILGSLATLLIFLSIGTGLFVFYQQHPELALPKELDKIYPHFTSQVMPGALRGWVLAAIVMASIDSPLASLTAAFVNDLYRPLRGSLPEEHYLKVTRAAVVVFALILAAIAYGFTGYDKMLWLAFKIGGVTYGSLLGIFLLGLLTRKGGDRANVAAMAAMGGLCLVLLILIEKRLLPLGWSWLLIIGTFGTMALAAGLSPWLDKPRGGVTS